MNDALRRTTLAPIEARDASELLTRMRVSLDESGFAWSGRLSSQAQFEATARKLGTIVLRTDIRISHLDNENERARRLDVQRPGVYQAEALAFHSDRPTIRFLGWYCVQQDPRFGDSMLIDTRDIEQSFTHEELETLQRVLVRYYDRQLDGGDVAETRHDWPLVSSTRRGYMVFYVPWNLPTSVAPEQRALLAKCADYVERKKQSDLISIRLQPGQCLFIDNHRMLHARQALPSDSPRHLIRLYVR